MRDSIHEAIASTVSDMLDAELKVSFNKKELDKLGVDVVSVTLSSYEIKTIRQRLDVSQSVFAKLLNVSLSSVRHWEQNRRKPSGSTMVLLELLQKDPNILAYRISLNVA